MLRVNLLPPYIYDKQKKTQVAVLWGVGLAAVIVGMIAWAGTVNSELSKEQAHESSAKNLQSEFDGYTSDIKTVEGQIATTKAKQNFVASAQTYNLAWPKVYEAMASVTNKDVVLNTMAVDAGNHRALHLTGFCPDEAKLARWWMSLRNDVSMFDSVTISLPSHPFLGTSNGGAQTAGFRGMGMPGMGGRGMSGSPMGGMGMPGGPGMMSGRMGMGGMSGMAPMGGMGMPGGRGGQAGAASPTVLEGIPGLSFVANLTVSDKLAPPAAAPTWPAGGGGGGGMMGMGGMMPGGMGGPGGMSAPGGMMSGMPPMGPGGPGGPGGRGMMPGGPGAPAGKE